MTKLDLKNAMNALNVKRPLRLQSKAPAFQPPQPIRAPETPLEVREAIDASLAQATEQSRNTEQSGSRPDPVQSEQDSNLTLSKMDSVKIEPSPKQTGSKSDPVGKREAVQRSAGFFTQVPNELLRDAGLFSDPLDFMIYLHLYSYSWGFARETASMSQGQLEVFTGAARNTVRRSLGRLAQQGWIKMVEDYEYARMSRRWKVISPEQKGKKSTGAKSDTFKNEQGPDLTQSGVAVNPVTGSKFEHHKESIHKERSKKSLSPLPQALKVYFSELKPERKRESEWQAFESLLLDYSLEDISDCFTEIHTRGVVVVRDGLESTERCHSPMAFLSRAIGEVLGQIQTKRMKARERAEREQRVAQEQHQRLENEARESAEWAKKEKAFLRAFPGDDRQSEALTELCRNLPFRPHSEAGRSFGIAKWWEGLTKFERQELTGEFG